MIIAPACSPKYYTPNTQNVPLISEKGETNLTLSGNGNQVEFQGAYGVTENIAIKANGGLFIPPDLDNGNGGSGKFLEIGSGYFKPINEKVIFELYGVMGFGSFENHLVSTISTNPQTSGNISSNIFRIGVQPNIGFKGDHFTAAFSARLASLNYSNINGDLIFDKIDQSTYLKDNKSNFLIEPAITLKGGFEKIKIQVQLGYSINASNSDFKQDDLFLTAGLNFNFK